MLQINPNASPELRAKDLDPQLDAIRLETNPDPEEIIDGMDWACKTIAELLELDSKFAADRLSHDRREFVIGKAATLLVRHEGLAERLKKLLRDQASRASAQQGASVFKPRR